MNSIIDLNAASTRTFAQQSSFAIAFGANAGNAVIDTDAFDTHLVPKRVPLNSVTNAVRDVLIDVQFPDFPTQGIVSYIGPFGNIGVQQINNTTWRVTGIRDLVRYNEAFANLQIRDTGISTNSSYTYGVTIQDQFGTVLNYNTAVFVRALPVLVNTGPVLYDEDVQANITQLTITADANSTAVYDLVSTVIAQVGEVSNTTTTGNTVTISGNVVTITAAVTAGDLKFMPAPDLAANVDNAVNFSLRYNNNLISQANANIEIGNSHAEFSIVSDLNYTEDQTVDLVSSITDIDPDPVSYTVTWQQSAGNTGAYFVNGTNLAPGAPAIITNSRDTINAANVAFLPAPDDVGNVTLTYTQVKLGRNGQQFLQANAVPVSLTNISSHSDFTITTALDYTEDTAQSMVFEITDTNTRVTDYSIVWQQITPDPAVSPGRFAVNGVALAPGQSAALTGSKSTINAANVFYLPPSNFSDTVVLTYSQQANTEIFGTVAQGSSNVTLTNTVSTADFNALSSDSISFIRDPVNLSNWSIPDNNIDPVFGTRTYVWSLDNVNNVGNIWLNGVLQTSNVVTLTGNLTSINSSLANVSSYWEETANAEFTTAGSTTASCVFRFDLERTGPDARVLATNVVSNVVVNVPGLQDSRNNLGWQGGFFVGPNNGETVPIVWPYIAGNVGTPFGSDIAGYTNRFTTSSLTTLPPATSTLDGDNNTEILKTVGFVDANVCIQPAHAVSVATKNNKSDWYLPASSQINTTLDRLGVQRLTRTFSPIEPFWTSTVLTGTAQQERPVLWYNPSGGIETANTYANLRTQSGQTIQIATTVPHRDVWTQSNYYSIPTTTPALVKTTEPGKIASLSEWYLGLREDSFTYSINLESDTGNFLSNNVISNSIARTNIAGGSDLTGVTYLLEDSANTANITTTVTRNDGLVVLNNAVRQINLQLPTVGSFTRGGMFVGTLSDSGNTWGLVVSPTSSNTPGDPIFESAPYETANNFKAWVTGSEPFPIPAAVNDQYRGDLNTAALKAVDLNEKFVAVNLAVDLEFNSSANIIDDYYVPSVEEMRLILQLAATQNNYYGNTDFVLITPDKFYWTSTVVNLGSQLALTIIRRTSGGTIETSDIAIQDLTPENQSFLGLRVVRRIQA